MIKNRLKIRFIVLLSLVIILTLSFFTFALTIKDNHYYYNKREYYKSSWQWLDLNDDGIYECYYFNVLGHMYKDGTTPDGYKVNDKGEWIVDGDEFITEKEKEVRNRLVTKEVDEKILFDLQGQYITNMNDIYNSYYKQLVEVYDKEEITRVDFNDSKTALVEILRNKERLLKKKLSDLSKDILWQYTYDELK